MATSGIVHGGRGTVVAKEGDSGNTDLEVKVEHLPAPAEVARNASTYIVWIHPRNGDLQNVGALKLDDDQEGELDTTTPHRRFTVTVTPEASTDAMYPTNEAIFTTEVARAEP